MGPVKKKRWERSLKEINIDQSSSRMKPIRLQRLD